MASMHQGPEVGERAHDNGPHPTVEAADRQGAGNHGLSEALVPQRKE